MSEVKTICLITPGHISSNPRLVKEAISLSEVGYKVHIIFTQYMEYLVAEDEKILRKNSSWTFDRLVWLPNRRWLRMKISILQKLAFLNYSIFRKSALLINRNYSWQLKKAIKVNADFYLAHNLGALPVACEAAKNQGVQFGFDAEDFHRNEQSNNTNDFDVKLKSIIEDKYITQLDYFTTASPLIAERYMALYPNLSSTVINNVFEIKCQPAIHLNENEKLKLFWFSQTIGLKRGLEEVIKAVNILNNPMIELHLLGNLNLAERDYFNELASFNLHYHPPISGDELFDFASKFDVGLALELKYPVNRDICLTNKLFTYLTAGLAIIASNTRAQKQFLQSNTKIGKLYPSGDVQVLSETINSFYSDRNSVNECKKNAYLLAQTTYNWEMEKEKFLVKINSVLN